MLKEPIKRLKCIEQIEDIIIGKDVFMDTMMTETLQTIRNIEDKYGLLVFYSGLQYMMDCGRQNLADDKEGIEKCKCDLREKEKNMVGKWIRTANFECGILDCAFELSQIKHMDLMLYIKDYVICKGARDFKKELEYKSDDESKVYCPRCKSQFDHTIFDEYNIKFCPYCGQAFCG